MLFLYIPILLQFTASWRLDSTTIIYEAFGSSRKYELQGPVWSTVEGLIKRSRGGPIWLLFSRHEKTQKIKRSLWTYPFFCKLNVIWFKNVICSLVEFQKNYQEKELLEHLHWQMTSRNVHWAQLSRIFKSAFGIAWECHFPSCDFFFFIWKMHYVAKKIHHSTTIRKMSLGDMNGEDGCAIIQDRS